MSDSEMYQFKMGDAAQVQFSRSQLDEHATEVFQKYPHLASHANRQIQIGFVSNANDEVESMMGYRYPTWALKPHDVFKPEREEKRSACCYQCRGLGKITNSIGIDEQPCEACGGTGEVAEEKCFNPSMVNACPSCRRHDPNDYSLVCMITGSYHVTCACGMAGPYGENCQDACDRWNALPRIPYEAMNSDTFERPRILSLDSGRERIDFKDYNENEIVITTLDNVRQITWCAPDVVVHLDAPRVAEIVRFLMMWLDHGCFHNHYHSRRYCQKK